MKRFAFQFEQLLRVREFAENGAKEDLGREISALNEIEAQIALNRANREKAAAERFAKNNSAFGIASYDNYITRLDKELTELSDKASAQNKRVDEARAQYIEASREKKTIDKLKEKQFKLYKKEMAKAEG
jgi:flagellar FliJ protein